MSGIVSAFEEYPQLPVDQLLHRLEAEAATNPPATPTSPGSTRKRKGRVSVWPRDCALYLTDERRIDKTDKKPYTYEAFLDEYGAEQVEKHWAKSKVAPLKTTDAICGQLCALLKRLTRSAPSNERAGLQDLTHRLVDTIAQEQAVNCSAGCLSSLCSGLKGEADAVIDKLKEMIVAGTTHQGNHLGRRSAALAFSGAVKGLGLGAIKRHQIISFLEGLVTDKNPTKRQSALFCYELLFRFFGYPFEPYLVVIAPRVLAALDDQGVMVRDAAKRAAECIFSSVSTVAVKKLLPGVIASAGSRSGRLKCGATTCLVALTLCNKQALAVSLPIIVPLLAQLVNEANPQVQALAGLGLENVTMAIPNPEVKEMAPRLLVALSDPQGATEDAIKLLMKCSYVHQVDPASLSFLMPILTWGLRDKKAETKRCAVQIVGTLVSLVRDNQDLIPYLSDLNENLRLLLTDAIPDTRLFAARAFGMLLDMYGEESFLDLVPWLLEQMEGCESQIVTDGASDGLAEVLWALGINRLESLLPHICEKLTHPTAPVRTVFFKFLFQLPVKFPKELKPFIAQLNEHSLVAFADSNPGVRAAALQFGIQLVQTFFEDAQELVLPTIRKAMWSESGSTQEAALMLLGYLLARIAGETELNLNPDEMQGADQAANKVSARDAVAISEALGEKEHHTLLIHVSIMRSCTESSVSNMAGRVLRSLVADINGKVTEMFDDMMAIAVPWMLGKGTPEQAAASQRALGSLAATNKLLEPVMAQLQPLCELLNVQAEVVSSSHSSPNASWFQLQPAEAGQGVLITLRELLASGNTMKLTNYMELFVDATLAALNSSLGEIRAAGGELFLLLRENYKEKVVDPVLDSVVKAVVDNEDTDVLRFVLTLKVKGYLVVKAYHHYLAKNDLGNHKMLAAVAVEFPEKIVQAKSAKEMKKPKGTKKKKGADFADPNAAQDTSKAGVKKMLAAKQAEELKIQASKREGAANADKRKIQKKAFKCSQ